MTLSPAKSSRTIRSYVCRAGRLTTGQRLALEHYTEHYMLSLATGMLDLEQTFNRQAPCILEIGFGMGQSLLIQAEQNSQQDYLGIDVHRPGVGALLKGLAEKKLDNVRIYCNDAVTILKQCIPDNSLSGVQIFFPDPWPKKRHHKRRLIQLEFVNLLRDKLQIGAWLHLATDWANYAEHMLAVLTESVGWQNQAAEQGFITRPDARPLTKFELRGERLGHEVFDLLFMKV